VLRQRDRHLTVPVAVSAAGGRTPAAAGTPSRWPVPDAVLLGGLVVLVTGLDVYWRSEETRPPHWDMARHLGDSLVYFHAFSFSHPLRFLELYLYYPPLTSWVTDAFYALLGNQAIWVAVLSNVVFIAILVYATYGIGKALWDPGVGLLAAVFTVTTPMLVVAFEDYMLDAPLAAMVALGLYLLIRSEGFTRTPLTLLLGLVCGLGLLEKWTFPFPLALPLIATLVSAGIATVRDRSVLRVLNVAGAALLAFVVAGPWYVHNLTQLRHDLSYNNGAAGAIRGSPALDSASSVVWYAWNLVTNQLYLVPTLFLLAGIACFLFSDEFAERNYLPALTIVGTYVSFTLLRNKDARYTDPLLPVVAVVAVSWLRLVRRRVRAWLAGAVVVYGAVAFFAISFGTGLLPKNVEVQLGSGALAGDISSLDDGRITLFAQHGYLIGPPTHEQWHQEDVFRAIASAPKTHRTFVFEGGDSMWFNTWGTRYYSLRYGATWIADQNVASFVIVRGTPSSSLPSGFTRIRSYTLPDGEPLTLYRRV
jgi:4-amino-4-deoxy-L-arabinose transferase-like glycosyltransferase